MTPLFFAAASTSIGAKIVSLLPEIERWLRMTSWAVSIVAGLVAIAVGLKKLRDRKPEE
jgi:hypothetical protein